MIKEFLSSIGFGSTKVDTVIFNKTQSKNQPINGEVIITGGITTQHIDKIILTLLLSFKDVRDDSDFTFHEKEVGEVVLDQIGKINEHEEKRIPFYISLPKDHPISDEEHETILRTTLDIPHSINPNDEDIIIITH